MRAALLVSMMLAGCAKQPEESVLSGKTMGTTWHLALTKPGKAQALQGILQKRLDELDLAFSNWRESPVTRFNASRTTEWQSVPRELVEMVLFAGELSEKTNGAFDVTLAPVIDLWGFGAKGRVKEPPSDAAIAEVMKHAGWRKLEARIDPPSLRKLDPDVAINVSAMADGYACDELSKLLRRNGVLNFLLEIGGAVRAEGLNARSEKWRVGLQRPFAQQGEAASMLPLSNQSLSTSGVYRQHFENGGKRHAHVLDGRTGRPIQHNLVSVSVVNDSAFAADGWDTALLILGPDEGRRLAESLEIDAMFLSE